MNIVLLGFDFICPNKGCEALSYAFVSILKSLYPNNKLVVHNVSYKNTLGTFPKIYPNIKFVGHVIQNKNLLYLFELWNVFREADVIFDITYGDSFTDIYGIRWLIRTNLHKQLALLSRKKFILLPQTYGPFHNKIIKMWSLRIIKNSDYVFSRDYKSVENLKLKKIKSIDIVTDLAMALPYDKTKYKVNKDKINIGLNVSSLLWEGRFARKNEFGLIVNYQKYNKMLIKSLLKDGRYRIHLIPHVIEDIPDAKENDWRPLKELNRIFPETILPTDFNTPIAIKSYISNMDIFIGARMHSTIGAFSSGVPVIPFSYSRKFEGLFGNLNYNYVVNGRVENTESAVRKTLQYVLDYEKLKTAELKSMVEVDTLLDEFCSKLRILIEK